MDFSKIKQSLKKNAILVKDKTKAGIQKAVEKSGTKLESSAMVLKTKTELKDFIKSSDAVTKEVNVKGVLVKKTFNHRAIVIFAEKKSDFFKEALYLIPILYTKTWSSGVAMKMSDIDLKSLTEYKVEKFPTMLVFENKSIYKTIVGEEKIKKIVKGFSLDINKKIDSL